MVALTSLKQVRKAIESQYIGKCDIIELESKTNPITKLEEQTEVAVYKDMPCRKSYKKISSTSDSEVNANVQQIIELFIAPEINIKPGSKIVVTQNGERNIYTRSGEPAIYETHQQIILDLWKGWA